MSSVFAFSVILKICNFAFSCVSLKVNLQPNLVIKNFTGPQIGAVKNDPKQNKSKKNAF